MKESSEKLLVKAGRSIEASKSLLQTGEAEFAAGRAYYAMFYVAEALLNETGLSFRKHGGVHGSFGEHFVKTGFMDAKYHRWLLDSFDKRIAGDYGVDASISVGEANEMIKQAHEFLEEARRYLAPSD